MKSKRAGIRRCAFIEAMEPRLMFTAGQLDPSFGNDGIELLPTFFSGTVATIDGSGDRLKTSGNAITRLNPDGSVDTPFGSAGSITLDFAPGTLLPQADGSLYAGDSVGQDLKFAHINADGSLDATFGNAGEATVAPTLPTPPYPGSSYVIGGSPDFVRKPDGELVFAIVADDEALLPSPIAVSLILGIVPANGIGGSGSGDGSLYGPRLQVLPNGNLLLYASTVGGQEAAPQNYLLADDLSTLAYVGPEGGLFVENFPAVPDASGNIFTYTQEESRLVITRSNEAGIEDTSFGYRNNGDDVTSPIGIAPEPDGGVLVAYEHLETIGNPSGLAFLRLNADGTPDTTFAPAGLVYASLNRQTINFEEGSVKIESNGDISVAGTDANGREVEARFQGSTGAATNPTASAAVLHPPALGRKYAYVTVTLQQGAAPIDPSSAVPGTVGVTVKLNEGYNDPPTNATLANVTGGNGQPLVATYVFLMARRGFSVNYAGTYQVDVLADAFTDALGRGNAGGIAATYLVNFPRRAHGRTVTTLLTT